MPNGKPHRRKAAAIRGRLSLARSRGIAMAVGLACVAAVRSPAQGATDMLGPDTTAAVDTSPQFVSGRVVRPSTKDTSNVEPVTGLWVTLHRVGSDTAGPIDSMQTGAGGRYAFHYHRSGRADAIYFVSASYRSIAYFSLPLLTSRVTGDSAEITVFDTTSRSFPLTVRGRHVIVGQTNVDGSHDIVEVYEITNDSGVTLISHDDEHPTWTALLPKGAMGFTVMQSDISPRAVRALGGRVEVVAPIAPGLKQLSFSYRVPAKSFPLSIPMTRPVGVLEVLTQDPRATVSGPTLKRAEQVSIQGKPFDRYLGQDVPANAVLVVDAPTTTDASKQQQYFIMLAVALGVAMLGVLGFVLARRRAPTPVAAAAPHVSLQNDDADRLAREVAALDAQFEQQQNPSADSRASYQQQRDALKRELARALDARKSGG